MEDDKRILSRKIKNGDEQAFRQLFDGYKELLYAYAFKFTRSRELSEETVQEVFLKIWLHRDRLDPDQSLEAYLFRIARNQVFNVLKRVVYDDRLKEHIFYRQEIYGESAEEQLICAEIRRVNERAISQLSPRRQQIFRMSRVEGLSHEEIAKKLGISKNTVKDQIVKANHFIRNYLCEHAELHTIFMLFLFSVPDSCLF